MAFFGMFKSRQQRETELKTRVRQGTLRIQRFNKQMQTQAERYLTLARRAYDLDDQEQFRQLSTSYLQCLESVDRWERYLNMLRALELKRNESDATREFLRSMNALTSSILDGVKPEEVAQLNVDMDHAIQRSEDLGEALAEALDDSLSNLDRVDPRQSDLLAQAVLSPEQKQQREQEFELDTSSTDQDFWSAINNQRKIASK